MRKLTALLLLATLLSSINTFATDKDKAKCQKDDKKCIMGGACCKKTINKAAMLKAKVKPVTAVKKA